MNDAPERLDRPGIYHPMFITGPQTPAQDRWLDETCSLVEAFASRAELDFDARLVASLAIHVAADFLFFHYERAASWARLEPGALAARLARDLSPALVEILHALSAFYCFMAVTGRVDPRRAQYVASYFAALATIDDGSYGQRPSAPSKRARRAHT